MQEHRREGPDVLTGPVKPGDVDRALADELNIAVTLHKPGSTITLSDRQYIVQADGSWKRVRA